MKKTMLMTRVRGRFNRLLNDRKGQSTTEYILILAIVVMIASRVKKTLTEKVINQGVEQLNFSEVMSNSN